MSHPLTLYNLPTMAALPKTCPTHLMSRHISLPGHEQKKRNNWFKRWRLHLVRSIESLTPYTYIATLYTEGRKPRLEKSNDDCTQNRYIWNHTLWKL